jgi:hypothetical protein
MAFGAAEWRKYFGDVGAEPPLPPAIGKVLSKIHGTHLLVLVPQAVNGQPLTLKSLGELVKKPLQGHSSQYGMVNLGEYTDSPLPRSRWALVTRDVIADSRGKSYKDQQAILASYSQKAKMSYVVPRVLDVTTAIFMEYVRTGIMPYGQNPKTYTICQEKYGQNFQLAVGFFSCPELLELNIHYAHDYYYGYYCGEIFGVGGSLTDE